MKNNGWQQIPGHPAGNVRCIETGIEIVAIGKGFRWEVLYPTWQRPERKVMRTDRIFTTKIEALGHATKSTRRMTRAVIAAAHTEALQEDAERFPPRYIESSAEHNNWDQDQAAMDLEITAPAPVRNAPTPAERIAAALPATDTEIAQASRYATGLRDRILKRLQVAEARVAKLEESLADAELEIDRLNGTA